MNQIYTDQLLQLVKNQPDNYQFAGSQSLRFNNKMPEPQDRIGFVMQLLQQIKPDRQPSNI